MRCGGGAGLLTCKGNDLSSQRIAIATPHFSRAKQLHARFQTEQFEVRALFAQELALLKANEADDQAQWDDWEEIYETLVEPGLRLRAADGAFLEGELLIHIDGTDAWWRTE